MTVKLGRLPSSTLLRTKTARRETSPACGSARKGGDEELAFGEPGERPHGDRATPATEERREDGEADRRHGDARCDQDAERERCPLKEPVARVALHRRGR
jgi:hypothetical protein